MRAILGLLCLTLSSLLAVAKEEKPPHRGRAWVREQLARWELTREGSPPFRLQATLEVLAQDGTWVTGTYTLAWVSAARWREDLHFPGHDETEAMAETVRWWVRPTRYRPRVPGLLTAIVRPKPFETVLAGFRQTQGMACIEGDCVDARNGEVRVKLANPGAPRRADKLLVEFDPPGTFDARAWPAGYHLREAGREIARATIRSLVPLAALPSEDLAAPVTAMKVAACASPTDPGVIPASQVKPPYPRHLGTRGIEGPVRLRATIATDGTAQDIEVVGAAHREFADLAVDAVKRWRFVPAKCGDLPVPMELWMQIDWTM